MTKIKTIETNDSNNINEKNNANDDKKLLFYAFDKSV